MTPSKYSFRLLSRADVRNIRNSLKPKDADVVLASAEIPIPVPPVSVVHAATIDHDPDSNPEAKAVDDNKRLFLKIAGIAGLGVAASSLLPKKAEALVFGSTPAANVVGVKDSSNNRINPAKEDGNLATIGTNTGPLVAPSAGAYIQQDSNYSIAMESGGNLAAVNTNTTPFTNAGAGGYIRQDSTATMALETGGNLATIATNTNKLSFDGSGNLKTSGTNGALSGNVGILSNTGAQINPSSDDAVVYLRRIVKLMESQATVDSGNRQRITIDSLGPNTAITNTVPVSGTVTATVASTTITAISAGVSVNVAGQNDQMFQDVARTAYATGIRNNLTFQ